MLCMSCSWHSRSLAFPKRKGAGRYRLGGGEQMLVSPLPNGACYHRAKRRLLARSSDAFPRFLTAVEAQKVFRVAASLHESCLFASTLHAFQRRSNVTHFRLLPSHTHAKNIHHLTTQHAAHCYPSRPPRPAPALKRPTFDLHAAARNLHRVAGHAAQSQRRLPRGWSRLSAQRRPSDAGLAAGIPFLPAQPFCRAGHVRHAM